MATDEELRRALNNPDTRDILMNDLKNRSQTGNLNVPRDEYDIRAGREIGVAQRGISAFAEAERERSFELLEESGQRRGVLTGGATTRSLREFGESYELRLSAQLSEAQRDIMGRYGGYRQEAEMAEFGRETQMGLAGLDARTRLAIADIQADTTLSVADKQKEIARITGQFGVDVAGVQAGAARDVAVTRAGATVEAARVGAGASKYASDQMLAAQQYVADRGLEAGGIIDEETRQKIRDIQNDPNLTDDEKALLIATYTGQYGTAVETIGVTGAKDIQTAMFDFYTYEDTPNWLMDFSLKEKLAINPTTGISYAQENFIKNFDLLKESTLNDEGIPWTRVNFMDNLAYMFDELEIKEDRNYWEKMIATRTLSATISKANMLDVRERDALRDTLAWAEKKFGLEDKQIRKLHQALLKNNIQVTSIRSSADVSQTLLNLAETRRQFDISWVVTEEVMRATLELNKSKFESDEVYKWGVLGVDLLASVAALSLGDQEVMLITESIIDYIEEMSGMDMPSFDEMWDDLRAKLIDKGMSPEEVDKMIHTKLGIT